MESEPAEGVDISFDDARRDAGRAVEAAEPAAAARARRILITGRNSYIGTSFARWVAQWPDRYETHTIDMRDRAWRAHSFAGYDAVFHVAGIAHAVAVPSMKPLYYKVNCDLAIETATKARADGVPQFIFMSSAIVYGEGAGGRGVVTADTKPNPANFYGGSKLCAEEGLRPLADDRFHVAILRPPMVYGAGSKGNYPRLARLARWTPVFPRVDNVRSMLHIDNLCEFVRVLVDEGDGGTFHPQNPEWVNTSGLVVAIGRAHGHTVRLVPGLGGLLRALSRRIDVIDKLVGSLTYDPGLSVYKRPYQVRDLAESIELTERPTPSSR